VGAETAHGRNNGCVGRGAVRGNVARVWGGTYLIQERTSAAPCPPIETAGRPCARRLRGGSPRRSLGQPRPHPACGRARTTSPSPARRRSCVGRCHRSRCSRLRCCRTCAAHTAGLAACPAPTPSTGPPPRGAPSAKPRPTTTTWPPDTRTRQHVVLPCSSPPCMPLQRHAGGRRARAAKVTAGSDLRTTPARSFPPCCSPSRAMARDRCEMVCDLAFR